MISKHKESKAALIPRGYRALARGLVLSNLMDVSTPRAALGLFQGNARGTPGLPQGCYSTASGLSLPTRGRFMSRLTDKVPLKSSGLYCEKKVENSHLFPNAKRDFCLPKLEYNTYTLLSKLSGDAFIKVRNFSTSSLLTLIRRSPGNIESCVQVLHSNLGRQKSLCTTMGWHWKTSDKCITFILWVLLFYQAPALNNLGVLRTGLSFILAHFSP